MPLPWLPADPRAPFPPAAGALRDPDGLLAVGGDLHPLRLLNAYAHGIFPWFNPGEPVLWWSPDPRLVFDTGRFVLPRRFRRELRRSTWVVRADSAFEQVLTHCARAPRRDQHGTWIGPQMHAAYLELHRLGHAHSVEVFDAGHLVGGLYGVAVGRMFFGESMFSARSGGSKVALAAAARRLAGWGWPLIDAQVSNPHLVRLGATSMARADFLDRVDALAAMADATGSWTERFGDLPANSLAFPAPVPEPDA